jgi:hypothetical protein
LRRRRFFWGWRGISRDKTAIRDACCKERKEGKEQGRKRRIYPRIGNGNGFVRYTCTFVALFGMASGRYWGGTNGSWRVLYRLDKRGGGHICMLHCTCTCVDGKEMSASAPSNGVSPTHAITQHDVTAFACRNIYLCTYLSLHHERRNEERKKERE